MSLPISIGLELEFLVAYVQEYEEIDATDWRTLKFGIPPGNMYSEGDTMCPEDMQQLIHEDLAKELDESQLPIDVDDPNNGDYSLWQVADDGSLRPNEVSRENFDPYRRHEVGVEVKSPILRFSNESLQIIEDVCLLLNSRYHIRNNRSTGLHVHVGHFPDAFTVTSIKKLAAFLYTFEHQLSSLHPEERISNFWCQSLREISNYSNSFQERHGSPPTSSLFSAAIMSKLDKPEVLELLEDYQKSKFMHYYFGRQDDDVTHCRTIEFRQHAGSTDANATTNWIRVIAGIVRFCEDGNPLAFTDLLTRAHAAEKWEYMCDGKDQERQRKDGPILAHLGFTIIDLLVYLGLPDQAAYYKSFWSHVPTCRVLFDRIPAITWEYEEMNEDSHEYQDAKWNRELWDSLRIVQEAREVAGLSPLSTFDSDDSIWPAHLIVPSAPPEYPVISDDSTPDDIDRTGGAEALDDRSAVEGPAESEEEEGEDDNWDK